MLEIGILVWVIIIIAFIRLSHKSRTDNLTICRNNIDKFSPQKPMIHRKWDGKYSPSLFCPKPPNTSFPHIKKMQHIDIYQNIKSEVYEKQEKIGIEKYIIY